MQELIIATRNRHKVMEIQLKLGTVKVLSMTDFPDLPEVEETGKTFFKNALIKARAIHNILNKPVLADDSGLCVECLDGRPGVRSARYAGEFAKQSQLIGKLLDEMKDCRNRNANFTTVMVFIDSDGSIMRATGKVRGIILEKPKGMNGFGYDPVFYYPPFKRTFAELTGEEKNQVSHRSQALKKILGKIRKKSG
jgi:XTP/dITP diphosphohydrolase